jgi:hypothetical protein
MIVLMLGNIAQVVIWALLYRALGAFGDFETAVYFSGVTFPKWTAAHQARVKDAG